MSLILFLPPHSSLPRHLLSRKFVISPGEEEPLLFQIAIEAFLNVIQKHVGFLQLFQHFILVCRYQHTCIFNLGK